MECRTKTSFLSSLFLFMGLNLILTVSGSPGPLVHSMSSHPISNQIQLLGETPHENVQIELPSPNPNPNPTKKVQSPTSLREFIYRHPANPNQELPLSHQKSGEMTSSPGGGDSSPFFALSSLGDFQLSTYFSTLFWCLTLPVIGIAVLVYLQRLYLPNGLMEKLRGARALTSHLNMDLDGLTDAVYQGLSSAGKWAQSNLKEFSSSIDNQKSY